MSIYRARKSTMVRAVTLLFAVFFLVFSSCPIKKYLRLQLYKKAPYSESSKTSNDFRIPDAKDCSLADKHNQSDYVFKHIPATDNDITLAVFTALTIAGTYLYERRRNSSESSFLQPPDIPAAIPLYLRIRHLQV